MGTARKTAKSEDWISLSETARLIGEARQSILTRIIKGDLRAQHIAGRTFVSRKSVDELVDRENAR